MADLERKSLRRLVSASTDIIGCIKLNFLSTGAIVTSRTGISDKYDLIALFKVKLKRNIVSQFECSQTVTKTVIYFSLHLFSYITERKTSLILQVKHTDRVICLQKPLREHKSTVLSRINILQPMVQDLGGPQTPCQVCIFLWQRLRMIAEGLQFYCCLVKDILLSLHFTRTHKNNQ